jgi:hypothetical protein
MEKIVLEIDENLEDQIYCNNEIEITCKGNNNIKNCIFSNIINDKFIIAEGKIKLESNQFLEMKHKTLFLFYSDYGAEIILFSNLFLKCELSIEFTKNYILFHKNRIENCSGNINFNSHNHIINNEIVNNKNFEIKLLKEKNFICFNFFDYKSTKKSTALILNNNNNLIKGNQFLNVEYPITINKPINDIFDNDFFNSKVIFSCNFDCNGVILNLNIENNNFIQNKRTFNKKKYEKSVISFNNIENEELMKTVLQIKNIDEEMNKITDKRLIRKVKEEEKKKEILIDLDKNEMIKLLNIDKKLNEILKLSIELKNFVEKIKKKI